MLLPDCMKTTDRSSKRSQQIAAIAARLRRLLSSPAEAHRAWELFHEVLMPEREFQALGEPCVHPSLCHTIEAAFEQLTGSRHTFSPLVMVIASGLGLVHGMGMIGGVPVIVVFCEETRQGLAGLLLKNGERAMLHLTVVDGPGPKNTWPMSPASC